MFYYISGTLVHKGMNFLVIDAGGVGYKLYSSLKTIEALPLNNPCKMFTYMHVREDVMDIFGFRDNEELSAFEMLISVNGVGPKAALSILSAVTPAELFTAIASGDHKTLTKAQGVGGKLAQRVVLELKDKLSGIAVSDIDIPVNHDSGARSSAVQALISLGYTAGDSQKAVDRAMQTETALENIIREALKLMM